MATNLLPIQPLGIRASPISGHRTSNVRRTTTSTTTAPNGGGSWWTPFFGWSSDADYIDLTKKEDTVKPEPNLAKSRFDPGCFTEEKAKQLRMMTMDTASFHDVMYHSAIASRLASDFSGRSDQ